MSQLAVTQARAMSAVVLVLRSPMYTCLASVTMVELVAVGLEETLAEAMAEAMALKEVGMMRSFLEKWRCAHMSCTESLSLRTVHFPPSSSTL